MFHRHTWLALPLLLTLASRAVGMEMFDEWDLTEDLHFAFELLDESWRMVM